MSVKLKQIITRPSLHDMFWFELPTTEEELEAVDNFWRSALHWYPVVQWELDDLIKNKELIRPDINGKINSGELTSMYDSVYFYNPLSLVFEVTGIFKDLDHFRKANQEYFNVSGASILAKTNQTQNTNQEKVYDENDVFIENGLFNIE